MPTQDAVSCLSKSVPCNDAKPLSCLLSSTLSSLQLSQNLVPLKPKPSKGPQTKPTSTTPTQTAQQTSPTPTHHKEKRRNQTTTKPPNHNKPNHSENSLGLAQIISSGFSQNSWQNPGHGAEHYVLTPKPQNPRVVGVGWDLWRPSCPTLLPSRIT